MLRDAEREAVHRTLDFWNSRRAYEQFMEARAATYKKLDAASEEWMFGEKRIGRFESME